MTLAQLIAKLKHYPIPAGAVIVLLALGAGLFFQMPKVGALESSLEETEGEWNRIQRNLEHAHQLEPNLETLRAYKEEKEARLINRRELPLNQSYFYRLEELTGVKIISLQQIPPDTQESYLPKLKLHDMVGFRLKVEGPFAALLDFVAALEQGEHFARLSTLNLGKPASSVTGELVLNLDLHLLGRKLG